MKAKLKKYMLTTNGEAVACPRVNKLLAVHHCEHCRDFRIFTPDGVKCLYGLEGVKFSNNPNNVGGNYEFLKKINDEF